MKQRSHSRFFLAALLPLGLLAASSVLAGCPVFDDGTQGSCVDEGSCYNGDTGTGGSAGCSDSSQCQPNQTCGSDDECHDGDCTFWGCAAGLECVVDNDGVASCEQGSSGTGGSGGASTTGTATGGSSTTGTSTGGAGTGGATSTGGAGGNGGVIYCGNPNDCPTGDVCATDGTCHPGACGDAGNGCIFGYTCEADGTCGPSNPAQCGSDADCASAGQGYACVSGLCTAPADQCFDQSQCGADDKCAAGKCTIGCTADSDCRDGETCDTVKGICSGVAQACTITNDCGGATEVCVDGACVPRSTGGTCTNPGDVWVENGCIPSQSATFVCATDGAQDACASGSICLRHSCYISCDAPNEDACMNQPTLDDCKPVTSSSGTHDVCGTSDNLGGECDPSGMNTCAAGEICIDGFCK